MLIFNYKDGIILHFPIFIKSFVGTESISLSYRFYIYMIFLSIFCINSINIYADLSGLEAGKSLTIGLGLISENLFCIVLDDDVNNMLTLS